MIILLLIGTFTSFGTVNGQCSENPFTINDHKGHITSRNYPKLYPKNEDCNWRFPPPEYKNFMVLLEVVDIDLDYRIIIPEYCTGWLAIDGETTECHSEATFCYAFHNSTTCLGGEVEKCTRKDWPSPSLNVRFTSNDDGGNIFSRAKGFNMTYRYVECLEESTSPGQTTSSGISTAPSPTAFTEIPATVPRTTQPVTLTTVTAVESGTTVLIQTTVLDQSLGTNAIHTTADGVGLIPTTTGITPERTSVSGGKGKVSNGPFSAVTITIPILIGVLLLVLVIGYVIRKRKSFEAKNLSDDSSKQETGAANEAYSMAIDVGQHGARGNGTRGSQAYAMADTLATVPEAPVYSTVSRFDDGGYAVADGKKETVRYKSQKAGSDKSAGGSGMVDNVLYGSTCTGQANGEDTGAEVKENILYGGVANKPKSQI